MAIMKLNALLLVAGLAVYISGHPVDKDGKWVEQKPAAAAEKWPSRKPGLGTGGGVGGYHGVIGNSKGQDNGRGFDVQVQQKDFDDIPRTPVDGFVSQDREGHSSGGPGGEVQLKPQISPVGPASDSFKPSVDDHSHFDGSYGGSKDHLPVYHDNKAKESSQYGPGSGGHNPAISQGPGTGNIKPGYYDQKDKTDFVNPSNEKDREFIPEDKDDRSSGHDGKHHEHKPKIEIQKPPTPDYDQVKPIEQGKDSSVPGPAGKVVYPISPDTPVEKYPFNRPTPTGDDKFPHHPDDKLPEGQVGPVGAGDKYPKNPEGPINPTEPAHSGDKYPNTPVKPIPSGDHIKPVRPEHPSNTETGHHDVHVQNKDFIPERPLNGGDKLPINPTGPAHSGDKYPISPSGDRVEPVRPDRHDVQNKDFIPESSLNGGAERPINPTGPAHSGDKYPNTPVRPIPSGDHVKPVRPETGHHDEQHKPQGQDSKFDNPKDDKISQGHEEVPEKILPVAEGESIVPDEPTGPGGQLDSEKPFGPSGEGIDYRPLIPGKPRQPLGPKEIDTTVSVGVQNQLPAMRDLCQSLELKRFLELINRADMGDIFSNKGQITIFAPSDQAFSRLPVHVYYRLTRDKAFLKKVLQYHIIEGVHPIQGEELEGQQEGGVGFYLTQEPKMKLFFNRYGSSYYVNGFPITRPSQKASNGMIHVIDNVLYPLPSKNMAETLQGISTFTRFHALAKEAGLFDDVLAQGLHTVYAPSDAAFAKLPRRTLEWLSFDKEALRSLLLKHIVPGAHFTSWVPESGVTYASAIPEIKLDIKHDKDFYTINGVRIGNHDIVSQDGVLHSISEVLFSKDLQPKVDYRRPGLKRIYPSAPTSS